MGNSENFDDYGWGLHHGILTWLGTKGTLTISTRGQTKENLDLLENKEDSNGFCGELRMRNFDLLGKLNPWGVMRMTIFDLQGIENSDKFMLGSYEDSNNLTGESGVRIFNLLGEFEFLGTSSWRVKNENLHSVGE